MRGKEARAALPRTASRCSTRRRTGRTRSALLEEQARRRVPDLVPIRYGRMLASPFAFYRGAALLMAADLAATPVSGLPCSLR